MLTSLVINKIVQVGKKIFDCYLMETYAFVYTKRNDKNPKYNSNAVMCTIIHVSGINDAVPLIFFFYLIITFFASFYSFVAFQQRKE